MFKKNYTRIINIPVIEFTRRVFINKNISVKGVLLLPLYYIKLIVVMPAALLQYIFYAKRINKTVITKPPVFIVGHYRSGTTYLHKLLCADKRFGFVSYYDMICPNSSLLFGNWLKKTLQVCINKLKIKTPFFNNTIPSLDEPAEEERLLINKGSAYADYWKFVFPLQKNIWQTDLLNNKTYHHSWKREYVWLLKLISYKNKSKQLVLKSPCNTERIQYLLEIFPGAKFIYISSNPYKVFYSTQNLWSKAIQKFCLQHISSTQKAGIIFNHFSYMTEQYKKNKHLIPAGNLIELQYEELEIKPLTVLKRMYECLNMNNFKEAEIDFINQIKKEATYIKFKYTYDDEMLKEIDKHWSKHIHEWNRGHFNSVTELAF